MQILIEASVVLLAYFFGSIPFGLLIVRFSTGKDIRQVASGRTGGTNAGRAAGTLRMSDLRLQRGHRYLPRAVS